MASKWPEWLIPHLELVGLRYVDEDTVLTFDRYVNTLRRHCPTERLLIEFLELRTSLEDLAGEQRSRFYATWQEASKVTIAHGVKGRPEYYQKYKQIDSRLPAAPNQVYSDFPGWYVFLGKENPEHYLSWQEASEVCIAADVKSGPDYQRRYKEIDSRLPASPRKKYHDFPGWRSFLDTSKYPTWQEASEVCIAADVKSMPDYQRRYKEIDARLPANPYKKYHNFPGWYVFLGKEAP